MSAQDGHNIGMPREEGIPVLPCFLRPSGVYRIIIEIVLDRGMVKDDDRHSGLFVKTFFKPFRRVIPWYAETGPQRLGADKEKPDPMKILLMRQGTEESFIIPDTGGSIAGEDIVV